MSKKDSTQILALLKKHYKKAKIVLNYSNNWELLLAVILSAQCTDKTVNKVTKELFKKSQKSKVKSQRYKSKFKNINNNIQQIIYFAQIDLQQLEDDIRSTGFYKNKAKNIRNSARIILERFNGEVPKTMKEILTLPGVARKTANVVLGNAYNVIEGIAVDTHVKRLSKRLGFTKEKDPNKIEKDLMKIFDKKNWFKLTYLLIDHGRKVCDAKKAKCDKCFLAPLCPSAYRFPHFKN